MDVKLVEVMSVCLCVHVVTLTYLSLILVDAQNEDEHSAVNAHSPL